MSSLWSAFNKAAFSSIVVDPTYSLLPEHKARDVLRDALDHIKRLSLAERQQGADIVAAKFRLCTLSELDVIVQCILSHTFVVECLGISGSNDKLLHAFTNLCNHVLDHYSLNVFVSKLRDATANKVISAKTCECLLIMAFSKKETVWMRRRMLPAHHNHTLTHALMLLCLKQAFSDKRTNGIPILDSWMLETTKSLLSPNQASNINLLLNVERIVRVLGGLDMLSFDQTGTLLNLIVRYIVLIARLQRKTSIYDFMDSTSRIRSTAVSVSTAFGCLLTSDIFFSFLASAPDNASKGFLDGMVNEIVSPTILSDTATMVCGTILNLNQAGK
ncbi:hypothetical protein EON65_09405 [archaeon]|nr:MAG: hypothetical protein EON65_09405 [archaeon]